MSSAVLLTVMFEKPGFFLTDVRIVVSVNGQPIYDGSFREGFERTVEVLPGQHFVDTTIELGALKRTRRYPVDVAPARGYTVALSYSRFWGNFTKKPLVTPY